MKSKVYKGNEILLNNKKDMKSTPLVSRKSYVNLPQLFKFMSVNANSCKSIIIY